MEVDPVPPTYLLSTEADEEFEHHRTEEAIPYEPYVEVDNAGESNQILSQSAVDSANKDDYGLMDQTPTEGANNENDANHTGEKSKINPCVVCKKVTKSKYNVERKSGKTSFLCSDDCFADFRQNPSQYLKGEQPGVDSGATAATQIEKCAQCSKTEFTIKLCWQSLMFCSEKCLECYQTGNMGNECGYCNKEVETNIRGRFSLIYQQMLRQFCSLACMDDYRLHNNVCVYCAREVIITEPLSDQLKVQSLSSGRTDVKMFCSTECYNSYNDESNRRHVRVESESAYRTRMSKGLLACAVCRKVCQPKVEYEFDYQKQRFCGEECFYDFTHENSIKIKCCAQCGLVAKKMSLSFMFNGRNHFFCSTPCLIGYRSSVSRIIRCEWCREECPNLSMIDQVDKDGVVKHLCSLECLHQRESVKCEQCGRLSRAAYQLTIGTETKNFCSYVCVSSFQVRLANSGTTVAGSEDRKRSSTRPRTRQLSKVPDAEAGLDSQMFSEVQVQLAEENDSSVLGIGVSRANRSVMTRPATTAKGISCRPSMVEAESQTEEAWSRKHYVVPVPVPVYVPTPLALSSAPTPFPCPLPIPVPVPIFVPVPLHTADRIANRVNLVNEFLKSDKFELDVLEMARAIRESIVFSESQLGPEPYIENPTAAVQTDDVYSNVMPVVAIHGLPGQMSSEQQQANVGVEQPDVETAEQPGRTDAIHINEDMLLAIQMAANDLPSGGSIELHTGGGDNQEGVLATDQHAEYVGASKRLRLTGPAVGGQPAMATAAGQEGAQVIWLQQGDLPAVGLSGVGSEVPMEINLGAAGSQLQAQQAIAMSQQQSQVIQQQQQPPPPPQQIQQQQQQIAVQVASPVAKVIPEDKFTLKFMYGVTAWNNWVTRKNNVLQSQKQAGNNRVQLFNQNVLACSNDELNQALAMFTHEARRAGGEEYDPDSIYYLCLGIQIYLAENDRHENIFFDRQFEGFQRALNVVTAKYQPQLSPANELVCRIEEEHLWESKQLGPHSPYCLLNTLLYLNTKYFLLTTPEQHAKLSFTHITQQWRKTETGGKLKYLRYNNPAEKSPAAYGYRQLPLEQVENTADTFRCPLKIYEFYLTKCPEAVRSRADAYYLVPEPSCVADSPLWYSSKAVSMETLDALLSRIRMVREIQEALFLAGILTVEHLTPGRV